jgi:hypothetical protein
MRRSARTTLGFSAMAVLAWLPACSDNGPGGPEEFSNETIVSDPVPNAPLAMTGLGSGHSGSFGSADAFAQAAEPNVAYVSLPPDSFAAGVTAIAKDSSGNVLRFRPVAWGTSNLAIATVSGRSGGEGVVTATSLGTATITAREDSAASTSGSPNASLDAPWGAPENLGPAINTAFNDQAADLTPDGHRMYFMSDRPGGFGGNDLYVSRRRDKRDDLGWHLPENLGGVVNTAFNEQLPLFFEDEMTGTTTLYFNSNRPGGVGGSTVIYASMLQPDETFGPAVLVPELSSANRDADPTIRRDGLELILASDRLGSVGGVGRFDLWISTRTSTSDPWSTPVNLGPVINTAEGESRSSLSFDATTLYMISDRPGGSGNQDVWVSTRTKLKQLD